MTIDLGRDTKKAFIEKEKKAAAPTVFDLGFKVPKVFRAHALILARELDQIVQMLQRRLIVVYT